MTDQQTHEAGLSVLKQTPICDHRPMPYSQHCYVSAHRDAEAQNYDKDHLP